MCLLLEMSGRRIEELLFCSVVVCHLSLLRESEERRKVGKGPINCCLNGGSLRSATEKQPDFSPYEEEEFVNSVDPVLLQRTHLR